MKPEKNYGAFGKAFKLITDPSVAFGIANTLAFSGNPVTLAFSAWTSLLSFGAGSLMRSPGRIPLAITCASTAALTLACAASGDISHAMIAGLFTVGTGTIVSNTIQALRGNEKALAHFKAQVESKNTSGFKKRLANFVLRQQNEPAASKRLLMAATTAAVYYNAAYSIIAIAAGGAHLLANKPALLMLGLGVTTTLVSAVGVATGKLKNPASPLILTAAGSAVNAVAAALARNPVPAANLVFAGIGEARLGHTFWQPSDPTDKYQAKTLDQTGTNSSTKTAKPALTLSRAARPGPINAIFKAVNFAGRKPLEVAIEQGYLPIPQNAHASLQMPGQADFKRLSFRSCD